MPLVRSIDILADGFRIVTTAAGTQTVSSSDLTAAQKLMTSAQVETVINASLVTKLPANMFSAVHLTSVSPLRGKAVVSNRAIASLGQWW